MSELPRQLAFDLQFRAASGREDFLVSPVNAAAVAAVDGWASWPQRAQAIAGPAVVEEFGSTTVVLPDQELEVDAHGVLIVRAQTAQTPAESVP